MADEFEAVDDDKAERGVAGKHAADLKALLKGEPTEEDVVEAKEPDDDEEEEELPSRQERRSKRGAERVTARERAAAAEARAQVLQEQLELSRRQQPSPAQVLQGNPVEGIDKRIKSINAQLASVHDEWDRGAGKLTPERAQALRDKAEQLEVEKLTAVVERRDALLEPQRQRAEHARMLRQRAPDVHDSPAALQYAQGLFQQRAARGEPDSLELYDAVMEEARQVILGKRPKPDAASRSRATGMGAGARAGAGASEGPVRIAMPAGSALDKMARAAYPKDDPAIARQKWVNANGKAYLKSRSG